MGITVNLSRETALVVGPGGWSYYTAPGLGAEVRVRLGIAEGSRVEVQELHLLRPSAIELRNIPLGRIETAVNAPSVREEVHAAIATGTARDVGEVSRRLSALAPKEASSTARAAVMPSGRSLGRRGARRLPIPTGRKRPDSFYRDVANAYSELAGYVRNPAAQLAEANEVPTSTVYRWLKEARARGILAPRSRG